MNKLEKLRSAINEIDQAIASLFEKRMKIAKEIGKYKKENGLPILDAKREEEVIKNNLYKISDPELRSYYEKLLKELMSLSKEYQSK